MDRPLYLYGIVPLGTGEAEALAARLAGMGVQGRDVAVVAGEGLAALASPLEAGACVPDPAWLLAHHRVLQAAMADRAVLPCRFGLVAPGREHLEDFLRAGWAHLGPALARLEGKEEAGLKLFWRREAVRREIPALLRAPAGRAGVAREFALQVGQWVEARLESWRARIVPRVAEELARCSCELRELESAGVRMLWNAAFLIERRRRAEFLAAVRRLEGAYGDRLEFRTVAGLPPYSFADLRLALA